MFLKISREDNCPTPGCKPVSVPYNNLQLDGFNPSVFLLLQIKVEVGDKGIATQEDADFHYIDKWSSVFTWGGTSLPEQQDFVIIPKVFFLILENSIF